MSVEASAKHCRLLARLGSLRCQVVKTATPNTCEIYQHSQLIGRTSQKAAILFYEQRECRQQDSAEAYALSIRDCKVR